MQIQCLDSGLFIFIMVKHMQYIRDIYGANERPDNR